MDKPGWTFEVLDEISEELLPKDRERDLSAEMEDGDDEIGKGEIVVADLSHDERMRRYVRLLTRLTRYEKQCLLLQDKVEALKTELRLKMIKTAIHLRVWEITGKSPEDLWDTRRCGLRIIKKDENRRPLDVALH